MYDINKNENISETELRVVSQCITRYVGLNLDMNVLKSWLETLDRNVDHQISRDEFVNGLLENYGIRNMMAPDFSFED